MTVDPAKISRNLAEIIDLEQHLLGQAVHSANAQVDGHSLPGGMAMISLAPVGQLSTWIDRVNQAELRWRDEHPDAHADGEAGRPDFTSDEDQTWEPALQMLRYWSDRYRRYLGMQYDIIPTLGTEARFLRHEDVLAWIVSHETHLEQFAEDIKLARRQLENIVHAGDRSERTRVTCNHCDAEHRRLIKVYAPAGKDEDHDYWKCPACKHRYDGDGLRRAHAQQLRHEAAARYVNWNEARATLVAQGRSERTVRKWMACPIDHVEDRCAECGTTWPADEYPACPKRMADGSVCGGFLTEVWRGDRDAVVQSYCDVSTHTVMVYWPDLWRLHLTTPTRQRQAAAS